MNYNQFNDPNLAHFITFNTHQGMPLLSNNAYRQIVIDTIASIRMELSFKLLGYVLMPEHVHLIIIPSRDDSVGAIIGQIKEGSSGSIHLLLKKANSPLIKQLTVIRNRIPRFVFWQARCYDHTCRGEDAVWEKIAYCHNNPVRRRFVKSPADWLWSSYRFYHGYGDYKLEMDEIA